MPRVPKSLFDLVRQRAGHVCEYCRWPEARSRLRFICDHIFAEQHLGPTTAENLALCCTFCNLHKGPNVAGIDPATGVVTPLFNPRHELWAAHFRWDGPQIVGISPAGRTTVITLAMNAPEQIAVRAVLIADGKMRVD